MTHRITPAAPGEAKETSRLEAFSDGVFAIAITLLVLDLRLPGDTTELGNTELWDALLALGPTYLAFGTSFAFIGIMWINHHRLFTQIARTDTWLQVFNLLLLLGVTIVPFPTTLLADHYGQPGAQTATAVYSGVFVAIAIFFNMLWRYASTNNHLLDPHADPVAVQRISRQYLFGPLLYLVAFALAFVSVPLSVLMSLLLAIFFALPGPPLLLKNSPPT